MRTVGPRAGRSAISALRAWVEISSSTLYGAHRGKSICVAAFSVRQPRTRIRAAFVFRCQLAAPLALRLLLLGAHCKRNRCSDCIARKSKYAAALPQAAALRFVSAQPRHTAAAYTTYSRTAMDRIQQTAPCGLRARMGKRTIDTCPHLLDSPAAARPAASVQGASVNHKRSLQRARPREWVVGDRQQRQPRATRERSRSGFVVLKSTR